MTCGFFNGIMGSDRLGDFDINVILGEIDSHVRAGGKIGDLLATQGDSQSSEFSVDELNSQRLLLINRLIGYDPGLDFLRLLDPRVAGADFRDDFITWRQSVLLDPDSLPTERQFAQSTTLDDLAKVAGSEFEKFSRQLGRDFLDANKDVIDAETKRWEVIETIVRSASEIPDR